MSSMGMVTMHTAEYHPFHVYISDGVVLSSSVQNSSRWYLHAQESQYNLCPVSRFSVAHEIAAVLVSLMMAPLLPFQG